MSDAELRFRYRDAIERVATERRDASIRAEYAPVIAKLQEERQLSAERKASKEREKAEKDKAQIRARKAAMRERLDAPSPDWNARFAKAYWSAPENPFMRALRMAKCGFYLGLRQDPRWLAFQDPDDYLSVPPKHHAQGRAGTGQDHAVHMLRGFIANPRLFESLTIRFERFLASRGPPRLCEYNPDETRLQIYLFPNIINITTVEQVRRVMQALATAVLGRGQVVAVPLTVDAEHVPYKTRPLELDAGESPLTDAELNEILRVACAQLLQHWPECGPERVEFVTSLRSRPFSMNKGGVFLCKQLATRSPPRVVLHQALSALVTWYATYFIIAKEQSKRAKTGGGADIIGIDADVQVNAELIRRGLRTEHGFYVYTPLAGASSTSKTTSKK